MQQGRQELSVSQPTEKTQKSGMTNATVVKIVTQLVTAPRISEGFFGLT